MQAVADGNNKFALDLYAKLREPEKGNLFFSPYSAHTALAMTATGARGTTRDQMVKVLHLPADEQKALASGDLGRLVAAEAVFATSSVAVRDPANALFDAAASGGGILSWLGVHDIDALLWLSGEPIVEVSAMTAAVGHPGLAVEDVASVAVRFAGGAVGTIGHTYALPARGYRGHLALRGLDASVELGLADDLVILTRGADGTLVESRRDFAEAPVAGYGAAGRAAVADLLAAIDDGRATEAPIEILVRALEVIDAAYESARTGRHVRL
jgi:predicted dehydrogenase